MREPRIPAEEAARLEALRALSLLDTAPEERFDRLTRLARHLLGAPIALVSLVDADRQWFKSRQGLQPQETPRSVSFCGHAIHSDALFEVSDAKLDPDFADNPLVLGAPHIRFYAGMPLHASGGERVGTLCVIDHQPRQLDAEQRGVLADLAALVERELRQSEIARAALLIAQHEARLRAVMEHAADGILQIDADAAVLEANPSARRLLGRSAQALRGKSMAELLAPWPRPMDGALRFEAELATGQSTPVDVAWSPFEGAGLGGGVVLLRDLSERREVERIKDELISTVSHELRTPLSAIRGGVDLARSMLGPETPHAARTLLDVASRNTRRLSLLLDDLLDLERLQAGRLQVELEDLAVAEALEQARATHLPAAAERAVALHIEQVPGLHLRADPQRLQQVLSNLLSNAIKFSPRDSTVRLQADAGEGLLRLAVVDQGPGIPEAFRARIFQRFAQADHGDARVYGGSGLGLSICRAVVEAMGGEIGFDSTPGEGATFWINLPAIAAPSAAPPQS